MEEKVNDAISSHNTNNHRTCHHHLNVTVPIIFLLVILFFSAWVRFDGITQQGIFWGDSFSYLKEAKLWATGQTPRFMGNFYRPVTYFWQGLSIRIFGYNDYSVKLLHCTMDMISILLIFLTATILARDLWVGVVSSLMYAFLPGVVRLARWEMPHVESTFFVLLALFFFALFANWAKKKPVQLLLLFISGFCSGLAANTHGDLAFLAPGYMLYLFIKSYNSQNKKESLKEFLILASIFTFSFFTPYFLGFIIFGTQKVLQVFSKEVLNSKVGREAKYGHHSKPLIFFNVFYNLIAFYFRKQIVLIGALLVGAISIMIYRKKKKENDPLWAYIPLILILSYGLLYSGIFTTSARGRVLAPLFPLILLILTLWYYKICNQHFGKYSSIVFICLFFMLFLLSPKAIPGKAVYKSRYRYVYDVLKDDVNSKNKLLIAPVVIHSFDRGYQYDLYFGKNAVYMVNLPIKDEYNLKSLEELLKDMNIRYIFLGNQINHKLLKPNFPLPSWKNYRGWLKNEKFHYSLEKDLEIINTYIRSKGGLLINKNRFGKIYYLTGEKPVQKKPGLITNGSFEHWWKGFPMGEWRKISGGISRSGEATEGISSIRFEPDDKKGTRIIRVFGKSLHLLEHGSKLRIRLDAKAGESDQFVLFFTDKIK